MGSSLQSFRGKSEWFGDLDLIALVVLVESRVDRDPTYASLRGVVRRWTDDLRGYGPGIVNLRLDEAFADDATRHAMTAILGDVAREMSDDASPIPAAVLNGRAVVTGVTFFDYPAELIVDAATRVRALLATSRG